jgi:hypothetical protein
MILLPPLVVMSEPRAQQKSQALVSVTPPCLCRTRFRFYRPEVTFNFLGSGCLVDSPMKYLCMALVLEFAIMVNHLCPSGLVVNGTTTLGRSLSRKSLLKYSSQTHLAKFSIQNPPVICDSRRLFHHLITKLPSQEQLEFYAAEQRTQEKPKSPLSPNSALTQGLVQLVNTSTLSGTFREDRVVLLRGSF